MKQFKLNNWASAFSIYQDRRMVTILFLGFVSGLPLLLTMGTLSLWLIEVGITKATIGAFALVGLPYTFKFLWSPIIDRAPLPFFSRILGRRRSWMLLTQFALIAALLALGFSHPTEAPLLTAICALIVAFCSASQDIVIDAYRIELLDEKSYAAGAATIVLGYRAGMMVASAGALYLATFLSWPMVYAIMAGFVLVGVVTVFMSKEPKQNAAEVAKDMQKMGFAGHMQRAVVAPFTDFAKRPQWFAILVFIILYKLGDAFLSNMTMPFYYEMGFSKIEIANVTKVFGLIAMMLGGFVGGVVNARLGIMRGMLICGIIHIFANLVFLVQAYVGHSVPMLMLTIASENITSGMCTAALVAYLSSLCNRSFTATQYALLSSLSATGRTFLSSIAGVLAQDMGWHVYFVFTSVLAVPALLLLYWLMQRPTNEFNLQGGVND